MIKIVTLPVVSDDNRLPFSDYVESLTEQLTSVMGREIDRVIVSIGDQESPLTSTAIDFVTRAAEYVSGLVYAKQIDIVLNTLFPKIYFLEGTLNDYSTAYKHRRTNESRSFKVFVSSLSDEVREETHGQKLVPIEHLSRMLQTAPGKHVIVLGDTALKNEQDILYFVKKFPPSVFSVVVPSTANLLCRNSLSQAFGDKLKIMEVQR